MSDLIDRDQTVWTPDGSIGQGEVTYTALGGTYTGWRRSEIERERGPVQDFDPNAVDCEGFNSAGEWIEGEL